MLFCQLLYHTVYKRKTDQDVKEINFNWGKSTSLTYKIQKCFEQHFTVPMRKQQQLISEIPHTTCQ